MNWKLYIINAVYTIIYGMIHKNYFPDSKLWNSCFILIIVNFILMIIIDLTFLAIMKLEMYEWLAGYDKSKTYDKEVLDNFIKKLAFRVSLGILICSLIGIALPFASILNMDDILATAYANITFLVVFITILVTAKRNKI